MVGDEPAVVLDVIWNAGKNLEPDWPVFHDGYTMEVEGSPNVRTIVSFSPSGVKTDDPSPSGENLSDMVTAMPVIIAIPAVCDAAPGIRTYADLPLIAPRYVHSQRQP
jgi:hypothetical protein